jgi:hypothetical protein
MAKFRCKQSGNFVEFHNEYDIEQIRLQEDYEEIEEAKEEQKSPPVKTRKTKPKGTK